ncbi:aminotransferase class V-fold PLP-dependent enzyme [Zooshikella harenae]|uniref:Aminotransferase class V-fold PLP-dependent enzyme n=1 Tax=Zooshikella harenae TaxID=2827238 RepID=A0ABS5ZFT7_9GAMM|nr:aminotransferase class V-fold PLP-dependent enzyme [Zooshikella harenae]MBU2712840.1 aminotransferase class V-fold PLP-dependent enzyme [Zooshikella harenae]
MSYRQSFYVPEGLYFLNHSVGAKTKASDLAEQEFSQQWRELGNAAWGPWLVSLQGFRDAVADLFNCESHEVCPQLNVSAGLSKLIGALPRRSGRNVLLLSELDFPSMGFVAKQAATFGYEVKLVPASDGVVAVEDWQQCMDEHVQLALFTHVFYGNSYQQPVEQLTKLARENDIWSVVDVAQSAGIVPIDFKQWQPDAVIGSCVKWLCGGPGCGYLILKHDRLSLLEPTDVGWFSHQDPFEFDITHFAYANDALRFMGGTPSIQSFAVAASAIRQLTAIGLLKIRAHNLYLGDVLIEAMEANNLKVITPKPMEQRGGTICIAMAQPEVAVDSLKQKNIAVDYRPRFGVRVSPHIYNTGAELEQLIAAILQLDSAVTGS